MTMIGYIIAGIIIFLLLVILLVILSVKGNKDSEEVLRKQSIVIVEQTEELKKLQEKIEACCNAKPAKKAPVAKKAPAKKKPVAKKAPVKKAPVKKAEPKISKEEQAKRDAKREAMKKKVAKQYGDKKITAADLKNMKLTDLYGVGPKIEEYYHKNGIKDMIALSKLAKAKQTDKKFIENLPALKSFTPEMKADKIAGNVAEAHYMVNELTK